MSSQATNLATLYAAEHGRLRRLLIQRGVPAWAAADAVQEAFLRLLGAPTDDVRDLRGYLFRIAGNIVIDEHRKRVRVGAVIDFSADLDVSAPDPSPSPDAALMSAETMPELETDQWRVDGGKLIIGLASNLAQHDHGAVQPPQAHAARRRPRDCNGGFHDRPVRSCSLRGWREARAIPR